MKPFPCGLHAMTGLPCPLCGGTRAVRATLQGDWGSAVYLNALAFPAVLAAVALLLVLLIESVSARRLINWRLLPDRAARFVPLLVALGILWWVPHTFLALARPKPELVNLKNPVAAVLRSLVAGGK